MSAAAEVLPERVWHSRRAAHVARGVLDQVFGARHFRNEIIWQYRRWSNARRALLPAHQTIYHYSKSAQYVFHPVFVEYSPATNIDQILQRRTRDARGKAVYARDEAGRVLNGGEKRGHFMKRFHAAKAPATPTGTIGHCTRLMRSDTPGFRGCTSPVCVRSPSGNISTACPSLSRFSTDWMPSLPNPRSIGIEFRLVRSGPSGHCSKSVLRARNVR